MWSGTHCNTALQTITSHDSGSGCHAVTSPRLNSSRPGTASFRAASTMSGDESNPVMNACGQRSARVAVTVPGPQPRSTTARGSRVGICATRSVNGRARSAAKRWYWPGSQDGDEVTCGNPERFFAEAHNFPSWVSMIDRQSVVRCVSCVDGRTRRSPSCRSARSSRLRRTSARGSPGCCPHRGPRARGRCRTRGRRVAACRD